SAPRKHACLLVNYPVRRQSVGAGGGISSAGRVRVRACDDLLDDLEHLHLAAALGAVLPLGRVIEQDQESRRAGRAAVPAHQLLQTGQTATSLHDSSLRGGAQKALK